MCGNLHTRTNSCNTATFEMNVHVQRHYFISSPKPFFFNGRLSLSVKDCTLCVNSEEWGEAGEPFYTHLKTKGEVPTTAGQRKTSFKKQQHSNCYDLLGVQLISLHIWPLITI